jgi:hypothetical protein
MVEDGRAPTCTTDTVICSMCIPLMNQTFFIPEMLWLRVLLTAPQASYQGLLSSQCLVICLIPKVKRFNTSRRRVSILNLSSTKTVTGNCWEFPVSNFQKFHFLPQSHKIKNTGNCTWKKVNIKPFIIFGTGNKPVTWCSLLLPVQWLLCWPTWPISDFNFRSRSCFCRLSRSYCNVTSLDVMGDHILFHVDNTRPRQYGECDILKRQIYGIPSRVYRLIIACIVHSLEWPLTNYYSNVVTFIRTNYTNHMIFLTNHSTIPNAEYTFLYGSNMHPKNNTGCSAPLKPINFTNKTESLKAVIE